MTKNLKNLVLLPIAILLLFIAYSYDQVNNVGLKHYASKMEAEIHAYEKEITQIFEDETFINKAILFDFKEQEIKRLKDLSKKKYSLFIYEKPDSLVFWTSNKILPFDAEVEFSDHPISRFSTIKNGGYAILNYPYNKNGEQYALIGLIPITQQYSIQNEFLTNGFSIIDNVPEEINIQYEPNEYEVKNSTGKVMFYLNAKSYFVDKQQQYIILIFYLAGLITLLWFVKGLADQIGKVQTTWLSVAFIIPTVIFIRTLTLWLGFGQKFQTVYLFSMNYLSDTSAISLGNLLINSLIVLWLMIYVYRNLEIPKGFIKNKINQKYHLYFVIAIYAIILLVILLTAETFRRLILYSVESFDIDNLYGLTLFPVIGTIALAFILFTLFLFIIKLKISLRKFKTKNRQKTWINIGFSVLFIGLYWIEVIDYIFFFSGLFGLFIIYIASYFVREKNAGFLWLVAWVCIFGIFSSILFHELNALKEKQNRIFYAENLALERDIYMEEIFDNVAASITQDHFIKKISNLFFPRNRIIEQINEAYLRENFSTKYDYSVHLYSADSVGTKNEDVLYTEYSKYIDNSIRTNNTSLYYWNDGAGKQYYIADLPILADNRKYYKIVIFFEPKTIEKLSEYPELLLNKSFDLQKRFKEYDFVIYNQGKKIKDKEGNYPKTIAFEIPEENNTIVNKSDKSYLIHQTSDGRVIIIGEKLRDWSSDFSLFSYMFCLFLVLFSIFLAINRLAENFSTGSFLDIRLPPSLRNKIQNNVVVIVVLAFIGIGVTTVIYFRSEAQDYHEGRLNRKALSVYETAKHDMEGKDSFYLPNISALAKIHALDVNLYDFDGEIIYSSQPDIFTKDLLSRRMDPVSFHVIAHLKKTFQYRDEEIGKLKYSAAYMPVKRGGKIVAFLGLPYYSEKENSRKDIGAFMGRLLNVYVLIFIFAGIVTFALTAQITNPLDKLSNQMQNVKLGQRNEPLTWERQDEIGILIEQYNKMLVELERSANLLAKSEREGAWREMAKQVAHEIKNPLTPMKLQIQFLQRAYKSRPEDIGPLLKRTAYTMIEQIDGLTRIASDFSNFAKMPVANNEYLKLNKIVRSVFELFSMEKSVELSVKITEEDCPIYADRDQIVRVLNNIIKNAIQAITYVGDYETGGTVKIILERKGDFALVAVEDNGVGIPDDKKDKVFVPNFTTKNSGTGLGLAMSKNIVEATGGMIYFESVPNVGTTFFVKIPITERNENDNQGETEHNAEEH